MFFSASFCPIVLPRVFFFGDSGEDELPPCGFPPEVFFFNFGLPFLGLFGLPFSFLSTSRCPLLLRVIPPWDLLRLILALPPPGLESATPFSKGSYGLLPKLRVRMGTSTFFGRGKGRTRFVS